MWQSASRCVVAGPWGAIEKESRQNAKRVSGSTWSPPTIMWCWADLASSPRETGNSFPQLTESPSCTSAAACARFSAVIRLSAPRSSSSPQRPQFRSSTAIRMSSSEVGVSVASVIAVAPRGA